MAIFFNNNQKFKKTAFTLSETLITLTIIGVIAVIAVPNIIRRINDTQQVVALKKAYAMLDNAINNAYVIEGSPLEWDDTGETSGRAYTEFGYVLIKYLPTEDYRTYGCCSHSNFFSRKYGYPGAEYNGYYRKYKTLDGRIGDFIEGNYGFPIKLKNGMYITHIGLADDFSLVRANRREQFGIAEIRIDINGIKGPNRYGYDVFSFTIDDSGLSLKSTYKTSKPEYCNMNNTSLDVKYSGLSCGYWVLRHNNMDYKYKDVSSEW